jgi:transposase
MDAADRVLLHENAALRAALDVAQAKGLEVAAELAVARAKASEDMALIAAQKLRIAKLEREI